MTTEKRLDLIDRGALISDLRTFKGLGAMVAETLVRFTEKQPTVDAVQVVHGKWVGTQYDGYADGCPVYDLWECSNCREEYETEGDPPPFNYCPNCGAKMDGERSADT